MQAHAQPRETNNAKESASPTPSALPVLTEQNGGKKVANKPSNDADTQTRIVSTPGKNGYDKAAVWINLGLALVGLAGVGVAVSTLRKIRVQADK